MVFYPDDSLEDLDLTGNQMVARSRASATQPGVSDLANLDLSMPSDPVTPQRGVSDPLARRRRIMRMLRPAAEMTGAMVGGAVGLAGGPFAPATSAFGVGLGLAGAKQGMDALEAALGISEDQGLAEQARKALWDVGTGTAYAMGGQVVAKGISAGAESLAKHKAARLEKMVREKGLEWVGINKNAHAERALFTDPQTGSTLAMKTKSMTPKSLAKHVFESRKKFAIGDVVGPEADDAAGMARAMIQAEQVVPPPAGKELQKATARHLHWITHPQTMLDSEPGKAVYNAVQANKHGMYKVTGKLEKTLYETTKNLSPKDKQAWYNILNGAPDDNASPAVKQAAEITRRHILNPIARMHKLPAQGRFLQDYFPHIMTPEGMPRDIVEGYARSLAGGDEAWRALSSAEQGSRLRQAMEAVRTLPEESTFGSISKHRFTDISPEYDDPVRIMARYVRGATKKFYVDKILKTADEALPKMDSGLREYAVRYIDDFRGIPHSGEVMTNEMIRTKLDALEAKGGIKAGVAHLYQKMFGTTSREAANVAKAITADAKLGANLFSPIQNLSQTTINTYTKVGYRGLYQAMKMRGTDQGQRLLQKSGVFYDVAKYDFSPQDIKGITGRATNVLLKGFSWSEQTNREIAYLSGYLKAQKINPRASWKVLDEAGRRLVDETQFIYDVTGRPEFLRGPVGSTAGQFKMFTINQLRFIKNLKPSEWPRFLLSTALHGGMKGIPGAQTIAKLVVGKEAIQYVKDKDLPKIVENLIIGGAPRAAGLSMERDVGVGFVPTSIEQMLTPPALAFPVRAVREGIPALKGEPGAREGILREFVRALPGGVQAERMREAYLTARRGGAKLNKKGRLEEMMSPIDILLQGAFGAKTTPSAEHFEAQELAGKEVDAIRIAKDRLRGEITKAIADRDPARLNKALEGAAKEGILAGTDLSTLDRPSLVRQFMAMPKTARYRVLQKYPGFREQLLEELASQGRFGR